MILSAPTPEPVPEPVPAPRPQPPRARSDAELFAAADAIIGHIPFEDTGRHPAVPAAPQPEPPKKKNTALIVTIIIVSLLLVAGGIVTAVLLSGNGDKNNNQSTTAATSATTPVSTAATQPTTVEPTTVAPTAKPTEAPTEVTTAPPEETTSPVVTHTATFINLDGSVLDTQTVEDGKAATAPPDPVMPDDEYYTYIFDGWSLDFSNVTSDMVVAARFKPVLKQSSTDSTESTQPEQ